MLKSLLKGFKNEFAVMKSGVNSLRDKLSQSYYLGKHCGMIEGKSNTASTFKGLYAAAVHTKISKSEVPSLFALAGLCSPVPGGNAIGYAVGRVVTSKPAVKALSTTKRAVVSTYSSVSNILKV